MTKLSSAGQRRVRAPSLSAAYAGTAGTFVGGEAGFVDRPVAGTASGEQVRPEFEAFRAKPVLNGGATVDVGGEQGYVDGAVSQTTGDVARST